MNAIGPVTELPNLSAVPVQMTPPFGHIVSVSGSQAVATLTSLALDSESGTGNRIELGVLVTIATANSCVIGIVSAMSSPMPVAIGDDQEIRLIELSLAGEVITDRETGKLHFRRGISSSPALGDPVAQASRDELACVYYQPDKPTIQIGTLFQDSSVPARLIVDELLAKHFLVVGTTGSGKSCTVASILQRVLDEYPYARVVVLDVHSEYAQAFGNRAECIDPGNLRLPFWLLNFRELCTALTTPDGDREAEVQVLSDAVLAAKRRTVGGQVGQIRSAISAAAPKRVPNRGGAITVDTPMPFLLSDVTAYLDEQLGKLERTQSPLTYTRLKNRIEAVSGDPRFGFMFRSLSVEDTMADVLGRIFRVPTGEKPITIVDLATVPPEILDIVIALIARLAFDLALWSGGQLPMLLICEEAHRYIPALDSNKFMPTREALTRIAKEGRKYGISLGLVTQRPSELDSTIISQCSTVIAMRLSTERDQEVMRVNTHDCALGLMDYLPVLGDREAIMLGQGVAMPMRVRLGDLHDNEKPVTPNRGFSSAWKSTNVERRELEKVVAQLRSVGNVG